MRPSSLTTVLSCLLGFTAGSAVFSTPAAAQTPGSFFIPSDTPTTGTCNSFPFGQSSSIYQCTATPAELGNLPAGSINDLAFAPCSSTTITFSSIEITLAQTTTVPLSTTFANNLMTNPQVVLKATNYVWPVTGNQWNRIGLDKPYPYIAAQGNLVVQIVFSGASGGVSMHRDVGQRVYSNGWGTTPPATGSSGNAALKWEVVFTGSDASVFGLGCQGSNSQTPTLSFTGNAASGTPLGINLSNALPTVPLFLAVDIQRREPALDLGIIGAPGCRLYVDNLLTLGGMTDAAGASSVNIAIPAATPSGIHVYFQYFPFDQSANNLGLTASNFGRVLSGI